MAKKTARIQLREAPHKRAMCETKMRYDVLLDGKLFDTLYFNMRGYCGYLPTLDGKKLDIGERSISAFRAEIRKVNAEFREAAQPQ